MGGVVGEPVLTGEVGWRGCEGGERSGLGCVTESDDPLLSTPFVVGGGIVGGGGGGAGREENGTLAGCLWLLEPSSEWSEVGLTTMRLRFLALNMRVSSDIVLHSEGGREGAGVDGEEKGD